VGSNPSGFLADPGEGTIERHGTMIRTVSTPSRWSSSRIRARAASLRASSRSLVASKIVSCSRLACAVGAARPSSRQEATSMTALVQVIRISFVDRLGGLSLAPGDG
jgi:hypothetical protein